MGRKQEQDVERPKVLRNVLAAAGCALAGVAAAAPAATLPPPPAGMQVSAEQGIDFVTIGDPGNPAYPGNQFGLNQGRGSVPYAYRIARTEFTTGQWLEFANNFTTESREIDQLFQSQSTFSAVRADVFYNGPGRRYIPEPTITNATRVPVQMSWRLFALYCNWLNNDRPTTWAGIQQGTYDATTFGENGSVFTDQLTRSPGARFWIPSLDEWLKAVHYDPNKAGTGRGGWWDQPNGSNDELIPGAPGVGQTSAGWDDLSVFTLPVAAYQNVMTPSGLFDVSGGLSEWTEESVSFTFGSNDYFARVSDGSQRGAGLQSLRFDDAGFVDRRGPDHGVVGLRIASSIPSPSALIVVAMSGSYLFSRRKRRYA